MEANVAENRETAAAPPEPAQAWPALREVRFVFSLDGSLALWAPLAYYDVRRAPTGSLAVQQLEIVPISETDADHPGASLTGAVGTDLRITLRPNGSLALVVPLANYDVMRNYPSGSLGAAPTVERIIIAPRYARSTSLITSAHNRDTAIVKEEAENGSL